MRSLGLPLIRSRVSAALAFACACVLASAGHAQILEVNVTDSPDFKDGQPAVAINPTDPDNLVLTATHHTCPPPVPPNPPGMCSAFACFFAYSEDRGETWTSVPEPSPSSPGLGCGEPNLAVHSDGTFYVSWNELGANLDPLIQDRLVTSWSTDGGKTWSPAVRTSAGIGANPKNRVDVMTGKVYGIGGQALVSSQLAVSQDAGRTWSSPLASPPGQHIAAHDGILASASQTNALVLMFHVSRDDGATWLPRPVTDSTGMPVTAGTGSAAPDPSPWVSADPTRTGRFAVMQARDDTFEVYVTEDAGMSWTGPAVIPTPGAAGQYGPGIPSIGFPWMDFGPTGLLGVVWETSADLDAVDVYSVVSFDHGRTFSGPVQVNSVTAPFGEAGSPGDDWSWITVDDDHAFVSWSDYRTGDLEGFFARVPLSLFAGSSGATALPEPVASPRLRRGL